MNKEDVECYISNVFVGFFFFGGKNDVVVVENLI